MQTFQIDISTQRQLAEETRRRWRIHGKNVDARRFLNQNSDVSWDRSLLVSVVYEAYRLKRKSGEQIDDEAYVRQFPELGESLRHLITAGHLVQQEWIDDVDDDDAWPVAGEVFADFLLREELGQGAFARVYLALEGSMRDRPVVVKIAREVSDEAATLARLQHTNIVPVHSVKKNEVSGFTALCMPFFGRATLRDVIQNLFTGSASPLSAKSLLSAVATLNEDQPTAAVAKDPEPILHSGRYEDAVLWVGAELCDALQFAHDNGVFHGDMKPSNVLIDANGHPLLFDFNLARTDGDDVGGVGGTLAYMAPEQLALLAEHAPDESFPFSASSVDVYSLGATLYEALSGRRPFDLAGPAVDRNPADALLKLQQSGPAPLNELRGDVDPQVAAAIQSCLAFNPAKRPQSAGELGKTLRKLLLLRPRTERLLRRHPRLVTTMATVTTLTVLAVATWLALRPPYHERQYLQAADKYLATNYAEALDNLNTAVTAEPGFADGFDLRALVHLRMAEAFRAEGSDEAAQHYVLARENFMAASAVGEHDPRRKECEAYCAHRCFDFAGASGHYYRAIQEGHDSAELRNNYGVICLKMGDDVPAEEQFNAAVEQNPELPIPRFNRARFELKKATDLKLPVSRVAVEDIEAAVRSAPGGGVHMVAAQVYARCSPVDIAGIIRHLRGAISYGYQFTDQTAAQMTFGALDPDGLRQQLDANPEFKELEMLPPGPVTHANNDGILLPASIESGWFLRVPR